MKKMKKPEGIILHCTDTPDGRKHTVREIRAWHVQGRGWSDIGYHFVLGVEGQVWKGRCLDYQGAHTKGHNNTVGIAYVGRTDMNEKQEAGLRRLVASLRRLYGDLELYGHNEFTDKGCPGFGVVERLGYEFCYPGEVLPVPEEEYDSPDDAAVDVSNESDDND